MCDHTRFSVWFPSLLLLPYPCNALRVQFLDILLFGIYIIISNQLFAAKHSNALWFFLMGFLFFPKLTLALFLHLLCYFCGCCSAVLAHKCLTAPPTHTHKAPVCIVCISLCCIRVFISNDQCEVIEQVAEKRCTQLVFLYHWVVTFSYLLTAHVRVLKLSFSLLLHFLKIPFCKRTYLLWISSFELWVF